MAAGALGGGRRGRSSGLFGKCKPINPIESLLMRVIYLKKYSKQAE